MDNSTRVPLRRVVREWGRIGLLGFGGPPAHMSLLRETCVTKNGWVTDAEFEDSIAACNLLPGPASTQLAILTAHRVAGSWGAVLGGLAFICPGLGIIIALAALLLADAPPEWVVALGAGAGASVAAIAVHAGVSLARSSRHRVGSLRRWVLYLVIGGVVAATNGVLVVVVLIVCGLCEVIVKRSTNPAFVPWAVFAVPSTVATSGGTAALVWVAFKVGALSYGGGFVIIPMMQRDAVEVYRWMSEGDFLNAVALGQVTPGPVVLTVAVVGYAAAGVGGAGLAALVAFGPSFLIVLFGAKAFDRLRGNATVRSFLDGAGPAAIGAILGAAIPLARALNEMWQFGVLVGAAALLFVARRGVVTTILVAAGSGLVALAFGAPMPV
ncbi:MAG: chromate efflux transporter [Acidobacteria bacterium]|nr:chromate efflux transporter [Acidobacteriota bacterium]